MTRPLRAGLLALALTTVAAPQAAAWGATGDRRLSYGYARDHWPTIQRRLLPAGIRLAGELNRLLGPPPR